MRKTEVPTETPAELELEDTADILRRSEESKEKEVQKA